MELLLFAKKFQSLPLDEFADLVADIGFDGVDLTVRPGGYIRPEEVEDRLPEAVDTIRSRGLSVPMITTAITNAEEPYAEEIFRVAAECGVRYIKLGYWAYKGFGFLKRQVIEARGKLKGVEKLCRKYGVTAALHSHSGMFLTAEPAVVWALLKGFSPDFIGAYIDPGHMAVEGGLAGWLMGMDILSNRIRMVAVKDYGWFREGGKWKAKVVPLGEGLVPWREVFDILKRIGFDGPFSLHSEYRGLSLRELIEQTRRDICFIKNIMEQA